MGDYKWARSLLDRSYEKRGLPRITDMPKAVNIEIKGEK